MEPDNLLKEFRERIQYIKDRPELYNLKSEYIGKKGKLGDILKSIKHVSGEKQKETGKAANLCKQEMIVLIDKKLAEIETEEINGRLEKNWTDITLTDSIRALSLNSAGYHPVTKIRREIEDIFLSMGFDILDGPHIEDDYHNFEALNFPPGHPARDMQDTFWFSDMKHLLRTHTSCIQVRGMQNKKPPFKFVGPGKVYRCETSDASHESAFHQIEGMMVGKNISVANLIYFMNVLINEIFKKEVTIRLRPGYFPFVEPGFELDINCLICDGYGCSVCKQSGWVELLPCGMVHPNVLEYGNVDFEEYTGFAFGLGLDRLVMMRYKIDDIRLIHSGDLRFITQFKEF